MSFLMFSQGFHEVSMSFLAVIAFLVNGLRTDGPTTDRRTNRWTKPLIEMRGRI